MSCPRWEFGLLVKQHDSPNVTFVGEDWDPAGSVKYIQLSSCRKYCNIPDYFDGMVMYEYIAITPLIILCWNQLATFIFKQNFLQHSRLYWWDGNVWIYSNCISSPYKLEHRKKFWMKICVLNVLHSRSSVNLMKSSHQFNLESCMIIQRKIFASVYVNGIFLFITVMIIPSIQTKTWLVLIITMHWVQEWSQLGAVLENGATLEGNVN